jgi:hypothetical protein
VAAAPWHLDGLPYMNTLRLGFRAHRASYCLANALDGHPDPFGSPLELAQPSLAVFSGAFVLLAEAVHLELEDPPAVIRPRWFRQLVEARLVFVGEVAVGRHRPYAPKGTDTANRGWERRFEVASMATFHSSHRRPSPPRPCR